MSGTFTPKTQFRANITPYLREIKSRISTLVNTLATMPEVAPETDFEEATTQNTKYVSPVWLWSWFKDRILTRNNTWSGNNVFKKNIISVIGGNLILNDTHHNSILLLKVNCTIIIESTLRNDFVCDARVFNNIVVNFTGAINTAESDGTTITGKGMFTVFKDNGNVIICGDF